MPAPAAIEELDKIIAVIARMQTGSCLGEQIKDVTRCIHSARAHAKWSIGPAIAARKLRAKSAIYAMKYIDVDDPTNRAQNEKRLDEVRAVFLELRAWLEIAEPIEPDVD